MSLLIRKLLPFTCLLYSSVFFFGHRPESLGIVVGVVFLIVAIIFQYFNFTEDSNVSLLVLFDR